MRLGWLLATLAFLAACQGDITLPPLDLVDASDGGQMDATVADAEAAD